MRTHINRRLLVSFSAGIAVPRGDYARFGSLTKAHYVGNIYEGYNLTGEALQGFSGEASVTYFFSNHFGILGTYYSIINKAKSKTYNDLYVPDPPPDYLGNPPPPPPPNYISLMIYNSYEAGSWRLNGYLLGLVYEKNWNRISLSIKILGGAQTTECPENIIKTLGETLYNHDPTTYYSNFEGVQPKIRSINFVFNPGLGLGIKVSKRIQATLGGEYLTSHATFNGNIYNSFSFKNFYYSDIIPISFSKHISFFSYSVGLSYQVK